MLNRKEKELKQREENRQYENGRLLKRLKECPNRAFKNYLKHHHIKTIAVYGAGAVGKTGVEMQVRVHSHSPFHDDIDRRRYRCEGNYITTAGKIPASPSRRRISLIKNVYLSQNKNQILGGL